MIPSDPKHQPHHPHDDDFSDEWEFDDNFVNNNNTTTDIDYDNSQSVRWDFYDNFILELKVKTATDATESIVFVDNPNMEFDDDINDSETEFTQDKDSPPKTFLLPSSSSNEPLLDYSPKLQCHTYQKAYRANNCNILPTTIYNSHLDPSTLEFLGYNYRGTTDINFSMTTLLPTLLRYQLYQHHPIHDLVHVILLVTNQ